MNFLRFVLAFCGMLNTTHEHLRFMFEIISLNLLLSLLYVSFCKKSGQRSSLSSAGAEKAPPLVSHTASGGFQGIWRSDKPGKEPA